ncbi:MAG: alkaline phosphatase [Acidobacteria bacterium]|nr:alkaline phosphatase [Acidobacteriota bacterium]
MNRRSLLSVPLGLGAAAVLSPAQVKAKAGRPKNIIFCVSDGMSPGVLMMAEYFSKIARGKGTRWAALMNDMTASRGVQDVAALNSPVTDSSSSSSAWGSGSRINNAQVNVLPDGTPLTPIMQLAKQAGKRTALVTTATVTHATPAGFAASQPRRDDEHLIGLQYQDRVNVVMGGGVKFFEAGKRKDKVDAVGKFAQAGYRVMRTKAEIKQAGKVLGLFSDGHMPYTIEKADVPTLAEMTQFALDGMAGASKGFIMQVEGARVDHAAHNNDIAAQLWDQLAFDDALGVCLDYAAKRGDTLVITTSDHGNSSPGLNGMGAEYVNSGKCFEAILKAKGSFDQLPKMFGSKPTAARVREVIEAQNGVVITPTEAEWVAAAAGGKKGISINRLQDVMFGVLGQVLSNYYGVGYTGTTHTSEYTFITSTGPGSLPFEGLVRNTDVFPRLTKYMGIQFKNPAAAQG